MTGPLLASGEFISETFNTMAVRYDPATGMVGASVSGRNSAHIRPTSPPRPSSSASKASASSTTSS
jgi:hypothetical protein